MFWKIIRLAPLSCAAYPLLAPIAMLATLLAWVLSPLIAGISMVTGSNQVLWLRWFYTHDASLDGGIEQAHDGYDPNAKGLKLWWQRVCWVCRNPASSFDAYVLGYPADGSKVIFESGVSYPPVRYWAVIELKSGRRIFGYRHKGIWWGWKHEPIEGLYQIKAKPF
ncbi:hypothetical protein AS026_21270 [Rhizobium altiplani]|uniref:Uncharacterized protein n=1 Tax=Rhizobium altiplani TaxID=1864509 RepID=A0A120FF24_9HYPH|nr:hypothetical protein [Rhizobium altiplani]KWV42142.1 hypothetical protein AS026_21270 [Rhizobium altiplani]